MAEGSSGRPEGLLAGLTPGSLVAGYRLEDQIGAGGMAVVFRARDERLDRLVALKVLTPALAADMGFRQRFIRESRAAAAVDHPHIIPVHEAGEADGVLYIAMRLVAGGDLRSAVAGEGPLPPGRAAALLSPVASALDAAHRAGLVHRDVKPANILLDSSAGRPDHVYLSDFGLSKGELSSASLTGAGLFIGTPDYSAPEQISGAAVDRRADQYALACVAFMLLTGQVPFHRDDPMAVMYAHLSAPPPPVTAFRPDLPRTADEVVAKALSKEPANRFGSCGEFAEALRGALGLPPYGYPFVGYQGPPAVVASHQRTQLTPPIRLASAEEAPTAIPKAPDVPAADPALPVSPRRPQIRRIALAGAGIMVVVVAAIFAATLLNPSARHGLPPASNTTITLGGTLTDPGSVDSLAFTPDGKSLVTADGYGVLFLWDIGTGGRTPLTYIHNNNGVDKAAISPNGKTVAAIAHNSTSIYLWNALTRRYAGTLTDPGFYYAISVAFSPDSKLLAVGNDHGTVFLWNVATRTLIARLTTGPSQNALAVSFSPDGKTLAVANADSRGGTFLWNVARHTITATLTDPAGSGVNAIAFSADGKLLAAGDNNGTTYLWDVASRKVLAPLAGSRRPTDSVVDVAFSPHGSVLAVADANGGIDAWDAASRHHITSLPDPGGSSVISIAFSPNGRLLATGDDDGGIALWHLIPH